MWELLQVEDTQQTNSEDHTFEASLCSISLAATTDVNSSKTMKFSGSIQGHELLILVDSGSSHSFVSEAIALQLTGVSTMPKSLNV